MATEKIHMADDNIRGGNVAAGARDMLDALGVEWVDCNSLAGLRGRCERDIYRDKSS